MTVTEGKDKPLDTATQKTEEKGVFSVQGPGSVNSTVHPPRATIVTNFSAGKRTRSATKSPQRPNNTEGNPPEPTVEVEMAIEAMSVTEERDKKEIKEI